MSARVKGSESRINGVSVAVLRDTVDAIRKQSALGRYQFRARNQWLDGGHTRTTVKDFFGAGAKQTARTRPFVVESDVPELFAGDDRAMDPVEHLLAALGASVTTTLVWHAAALGIHVDGVDVRVEGDIDLRGCLGLDRNARVGFEAIRLIVRLEAGATERELDRLVALATRHSPVFDTLSRGTRMSVRCEPPF